MGNEPKELIQIYRDYTWHTDISTKQNGFDCQNGKPQNSTEIGQGILKP